MGRANNTRPRISYEDNGEGVFTVAFYSAENKTSVPDEVQTNLSFYQVGKYRGIKGRNIPIVREEGLMRRLDLEKITEVNRTWRE